MNPDVNAPDWLFRALGYIVLRGALTPVDVADLRDECERTIRDATGPWYRRRMPGGGIEGHYIPATCERTPRSLELVQRFAAKAEQLAGRPMLFAYAHHTLLFDEAPWHTDTGHLVPSVKLAAYLEPLDGTDGALRVIPGSHTAPYRQMRRLLQAHTFSDPAGVRSVVLATKPGDVIIFDERLWHASRGGHNRLQWTAVYVADPETHDDEQAVARFLASQFCPDNKLDYDAGRYPYYGHHFRGVAPTRWVTQLERLGALDAASAEEASDRTT